MIKATIILKSGKSDSLERRHPWVFSGAIKKFEGNPSEGDLVEVVSNKNEFLGIGHYQNGSIAIRILSFEKTIVNNDFWTKKIQSAFHLRKNIGLIDNPKTNTYRLTFAEGDGLPGLVVDIYNKTAVIQAHSLGMHQNRKVISEIIKESLGARIKNIYYKGEDSLPKNNEISVKNEFLLGNLAEDIVFENGLKFKVNWVDGQKTGFFIDQRENRKLVGRYANEKTVLNTYCYTGGFSVYALANGAKHVDSVDSSKKAMELTDVNIDLNNFGANHQSHTNDAMDFLANIEKPYDLMILDPPAFAKHIDVRHRAVSGYKRINLMALSKIASGGILFTFSCSQVIDPRLFESTILSAAIIAKRNVRVLHHLSQPADHPFSIFHPEGRYLKGLVLYVE
ncbi:MAG: class I SAM-dependent rRNA methyltransferase [Bacteroidales bacterium]|nr:class I SAM-dependent rRNA methyltransferase [Bacteroidales bacterium]